MPTLPEIRAAFAAHQPRILAPIAKQAAVAIVLHDAPGGAEMLFIERAERRDDPWSGHMAFPGGRVDAGDADPRRAAERETCEEVGVDLLRASTLGRLDDVDGAPPGRDRLIVSAFVYELAERGMLTPNHEVREALWVPVAGLLEVARRVPFFWPPSQRETHYPGILVGVPDRHVIWGLTYRFLDLFFGILGRQLGD